MVGSSSGFFGMRGGPAGHTSDGWDADESGVEEEEAASPLRLRVVFDICLQRAREGFVWVQSVKKETERARTQREKRGRGRGSSSRGLNGKKTSFRKNQP